MMLKLVAIRSKKAVKAGTLQVLANPPKPNDTPSPPLSGRSASALSASAVDIGPPVNHM